MQEVLDAYPMDEVCGDEELTLAFPAGILNPFMKFTYEFAKEAAAQCPNVDEPMLLTDAQVDQQKAVSDVNSLVAQGVNGIVTLPIFGDAQVPSFTNAQAAGTKVVDALRRGYWRDSDRRLSPDRYRRRCDRCSPGQVVGRQLGEGDCRLPG